MISGDTHGFNEVLEFLGRVQDELDGKKHKLYQDLGSMVHESIEANFNAEGRPRWRQRVTGGEWPILDKSGSMRDDAEQSALQTWKRHGDERDLEIMTPEYGEYHQYTGIMTKGQKVKREFVQFTEIEILNMEDRIDIVFED